MVFAEPVAFKQYQSSIGGILEIVFPLTKVPIGELMLVTAFALAGAIPYVGVIATTTLLPIVALAGKIFPEAPDAISAVPESPD
jgi:hypothetical protein